MSLDGISADLTLADQRFQIFRQMSRAPRAMVEIASETMAARLPALQGDRAHPETYGAWLLRQLGLPRIEVPSAPTRPDSDPSPVSINDYLLYSDLPKEEIRSDVFGHRNVFKDIKRRYVFEILYGQYDVGVAQLQDELREVRGTIRMAQHDQSAFERIVKGTQWENRANLESKLARAQEELDIIKSRRRAARATAPMSPKSTELRKSIASLDASLASKRDARDKEAADVERIRALGEQLKTQMERLTRAIVANVELLDIEFVVCPRCGADVDASRASSAHCYLCLQAPKLQPSRSALIEEQNRLALQYGETRELANVRTERHAALNNEIERYEKERVTLGAQLDEELKTFVSDSADAIEEIAAKSARLKETVARLKDYLSLYARREETEHLLASAREREGALLAQLEEANARREDVEARIKSLEVYFTSVLERLSLPGFLGTISGNIDRRTYMPSVSGRSFETLQSEGLSVEVNVAHALAHQLNALAHGIKLPNILLIDGISGAFGERGLDPERLDALYEEILRVCESANGALQVIVADIRVPSRLLQYVTLELTEAQRLVP